MVFVFFWNGKENWETKCLCSWTFCKDGECGYASQLVYCSCLSPLWLCIAGWCFFLSMPSFFIKNCHDFFICSYYWVTHIPHRHELQSFRIGKCCKYTGFHNMTSISLLSSRLLYWRHVNMNISSSCRLLTLWLASCNFPVGSNPPPTFFLFPPIIKGQVGLTAGSWRSLICFLTLWSWNWSK